MTTEPFTTERVRRPAWMRLAAVAAGVGFLLIAANQFGPERTQATVERATPAVEFDDFERLRSAHLPALIGTLNNADQSVEVWITRKGPAYTVRDASGRVLAELISSAELYDSFPELDPQNMRADAPAADDGGFSSRR